MKGKYKRRKTAFQKGHVPANKGKTYKMPQSDQSDNCKYVRMSQNDFELTVKGHGEDEFVVRDCDGAMCDMKLLRPLEKTKCVLEDMCKSTNEEGELCTMRLLQLKSVQVMFFEGYREHSMKSPTCTGMLCFDIHREKQRGVCWQEALKCDKCTFKTKLYKLYDEIPSSGRGRRAAVPNRSLQVGLSHSSMTISGLRTVLLSMNVPAPSYSGMQVSANKVLQTLIEVNKKDMFNRQVKLKSLNKEKGLPEPAMIRVEADGRYNNPLRSGGGHTPFAPSTQSVYTVVEGETTKKQIIAVNIQNKLCQIGALIASRTGNFDVCQTGHSGHCSATTAYENNIGDEYSWAKQCFKNIDENGLVVKYVTTDADSRAANAALDVFEDSLTKDKACHHLHDTRHFSASQKRNTNKFNFSQAMFQVQTKSAKEHQLRLFSDDLSSRCTAEFNGAFKFYSGNVNKMKEALNNTVSTIIRCVQGDHSSCQRHSFVCGGTTGLVWRPSFRSPNSIVNCSPQDEAFLKQCIEFRLSESGIEKTRFNTNTQAVESINRLYGVRNPKNITHSRNVFGLLHSAVHEYNNGIGMSIFLQSEMTGSIFRAGTRVLLGLRSLQRRKSYQHAYVKQHAVKLRRRIKRCNKFRRHEIKKQCIVTYKKDLLHDTCNSTDSIVVGQSISRPIRDNRPFRAKSDHTYCYAVKTTDDHNYCSKN